MWKFPDTNELNPPFALVRTDIFWPEVLDDLCQFHVTRYHSHLESILICIILDQLVCSSEQQHSCTRLLKWENINIYSLMHQMYGFVQDSGIWSSLAMGISLSSTKHSKFPIVQYWIRKELSIPCCKYHYVYKIHVHARQTKLLLRWDGFPHIDSFVQDCSNSIANTLELLQSWNKPLIYTCM